MLYSKEAREALTTKNPYNTKNADSAIFSYIRKLFPVFLESVENYGDGERMKAEALPRGIYADRIEIKSSANEPKLYAHVIDGENKTIFWCRILETSPQAYGKLAAVAGAYMEAFNLYTEYNDMY